MNTLDDINNDSVYEESRAGTRQKSYSLAGMASTLGGAQEQLPGSQNFSSPESIYPVSDQLSEAGMRAKLDNEGRVGVMDVLDFATSPLQALGDAVLAPFAQENFPDSLGQAASISGKAFMNRLNPTLGEEHEDYAGQIVEREFGNLPSPVKMVMSLGLGIVSDPTTYFGLGSLKAIQAGLKAKKAQNAGEAVVTNKGIFQEGFEKIAGLAGDIDESELSEIGHLAAKADRGDKEAIEAFTARMADQKYMDAANRADLDATTKVLSEYKEAFGDTEALETITVNAQAFRKALDDGLVDNDTLGFAFNINLSKMNTSEDVDIMLQEIAARFHTVLGNARGSQSVSKLKEEAANQSLTSLIGRKSANFSSEQALALRTGLVAIGNQTQFLLSKAAKTKAPIDIAAAQKSLYLNLLIQKKATGVAAEAGRTLRSFREVAGPSRQMYHQVQELMSEAVDDEDMLSIMRGMNVDNLDPSEFQKFVDKGTRGFMRKGYDGLYEGYVNSILSGPLTHAVNITSNLAMMTMKLSEAYLSSMSAAARFNIKAASGQLKEANAMAAGLAGGMSDVVRLALKRVNKEQIGYPEKLERMHELSKQRVQPALSADNFGATGALGKAIDFAGNVVRLPGNALLKEDKAFKLMNYRMSVNQQAVRKAMNAGKSSADTKAIYRALKGNPDEEIVNRALDTSNLMTFTNKLEGKLGKMEEVLRAPGLNLLVPFFRTPMNIAKFGVRNSFLGNVIKDAPDMLANSAKGDVARAKIMMGSLAPFSIAMMMGDSVTGHADMTTNKGRLKAEFQSPPYSIKVGDQWFSYERIEPVRSILGLVANYQEAFNHLDLTDAEDMEVASEIASFVVKPFLETVSDNAMLDTLGHVHYLLDGAMSGNLGGFAKQFDKMAAAMATPNFIAQVTSLEMDTKLRMADGAVEQIKKRIWGLSKDMPIRPNAFGEEQYVPRGQMLSLINPFLQRPDKSDKVAQAMIDLEVSVPNMTPKSFQYDGIEISLTTEQRSRLGIMVGKGLKEDKDNDMPYIPPMRELIGSMLKDPYFNKLPPESQKTRIEYLYMTRRDFMKDIIVSQEPSLTKQYTDGLLALQESYELAEQGGLQ